MSLWRVSRAPGIMGLIAARLIHGSTVVKVIWGPFPVTRANRLLVTK